MITSSKNNKGVTIPRHAYFHYFHLLFGFPSALYALVAVYVTTKVSDMLVIGFGYARSVYIVTSKPEAVAEKVFREIDRGVTGIYAKGMYTGQDKTLLFCVVTKKEIIRLKECIHAVDSEAFVIVTEAKEVHYDENLLHELLLPPLL